MIRTIRRRVFFSFQFKQDVFRVQQIRNIGSIDDETLLVPNAWETLKRQGNEAIIKWIDNSMAGRSCIIVLIGEDTANSKWVKYEILKAVSLKKPIFGIYIHNLKCPEAKRQNPSSSGKSNQGINPFSLINITGDSPLSDSIVCHNPNFNDAYNDIKNNIARWIEEAIKQPYQI